MFPSLKACSTGLPTHILGDYIHPTVFLTSLTQAPCITPRVCTATFLIGLLRPRMPCPNPGAARKTVYRTRSYFGAERRLDTPPAGKPLRLNKDVLRRTARCGVVSRTLQQSVRVPCRSYTCPDVTKPSKGCA